MVTVQEVATTILAIATIVLAWTSWNLFRTTRVLAQIEERRERARARERKRSRLDRKLELTRKLVKESWDNSIAPTLEAGRLPEPEARWIWELETLVDFEKDQVLKEDFGPLRLAFEAANRGTPYSREKQKHLKEDFERIKERLGWNLARWQNELIELSYEDPL
jgi:hypothetical protein